MAVINLPPSDTRLTGRATKGCTPTHTHTVTHTRDTALELTRPLTRWRLWVREFSECKRDVARVSLVCSNQQHSNGKINIDTTRTFPPRRGAQLCPACGGKRVRIKYAAPPQWHLLNPNTPQETASRRTADARRGRVIHTIYVCMCMRVCVYLFADTHAHTQSGADAADAAAVNKQLNRVRRVDWQNRTQSRVRQLL